MTKSLRWLAGLAGLVLGSVLADPGFAQSQQTLFCLADGTQISAERFETRDGKFLLYIPGSSQPLEYPASSIKGINVKCETPPAPPVPQPTPTAGRFGIHGSNTIGERLMPLLIEAFGTKKLGAKPNSKPGASEEQEITLNSPSGPVAVVDLKAHGSGTSAKDLIDGKSVIGMSSRRINPEETAAVTARFNTNPQSPDNEHVLALDGLAVIVNAANPVKELSLDQIGRIFAGQITNWSDVGGLNRPMSVFRRDDKSGTTDTFKSLVMSLNKLTFSAGVNAFESSETVSSSVAADVGAIGFIGLPYINRNHPLGITSSCGISSSPSRFTVKTETYPLARRLYLYTIGTPTDPTARDLLQFVLSDDAQQTVQEAEFVEQTVDFQDPEEQRQATVDILTNPTRGLQDKDIPRQALRQFEQMLGEVRRTSLTFRFEQGSSELDTRAQQDIGRLARFLAAPAAAGKKFYIAGFADSKGSWSTNYSLAQKRAVEVARQLEKASGTRVPRDAIVSMSYLAPTSCNDSDVGMGKNRRVEIWIGR
jgi:phosphate transport system substrate-binding protein